jgi:hypothetical protein
MEARPVHSCFEPENGTFSQPYGNLLQEYTSNVEARVDGEKIRYIFGQEGHVTSHTLVLAGCKLSEFRTTVPLLVCRCSDAFASSWSYTTLSALLLK